MLSPPLIALLLVANLIPAIALMVLFSRRVAMARAERGGLGSGRLHTRLVALFSVIAAVPTVLVAIFASLLFQSGLEFWFSDRARGMLENTVAGRARDLSTQKCERVADETVDDERRPRRLSPAQSPIDDPRFAEAFGRDQVLNRNLSEAIIFTVRADRQIRTLGAGQSLRPPARDRSSRRRRSRELQGKPSVAINSSDRIGALTRLDYGPDTYLYAARVFEPAVPRADRPRQRRAQGLSGAARRVAHQPAALQRGACCSAR